MPAREYDETEMSFQATEVLFKTKGQVTKSPGWRSLYLQGEDDIQDKVLPPIPDQMPGVAESVDVFSRKTTPPKPYTEATLLEDMASIAKFVTNPEHKKLLKETSRIGTVATRAAIIEELKEGRCQYLVLQGKYLHATPKGSALIAWLDGHLPRITDPAETALWEDGFREIEKGEVTPDQFVSGIAQTLRQHLSTLVRVIPDEALVATTVQCPSGKGFLMEGGSGYTSPGYPNVRLPKVFCGANISASEWARVLAGEKVAREDFYSKDKKKRFQAALVFNRDKQQIELDFGGQNKTPPQPLDLLCPKTKQPVLESEKYFTYPGWPEVRCWKVIARRAMQPEDFGPALQTGRTELLEGFKSKEGNPFSAYLVFDGKKNKFSFGFNERQEAKRVTLKLTKPRRKGSPGVLRR